MPADPPDPVDLIPIAREVRLAAMSLSRHVRDHTPSLAPHLFTVLAWLEGGASTASELATKERVTPPSMSKTLCELEDRGFVARTPGAEDARQKIVTLTPAGRRALLKGRKERDVYTAALLSDCSPDELAALLRGAQLLRAVVDR